MTQVINHVILMARKQVVSLGILSRQGEILTLPGKLQDSLARGLFLLSKLHLLGKLPLEILSE